MRLFPIFLFILWRAILFGQSEQFQSIELDLQDGLPASQIRDGFQCSRGYIWIMTHHGGLARYDGISVKTYTKENHGLADNFLALAFEAPDSLIWVMSHFSGELTSNISIFNPITERAVLITDYFKEKLPFAPEDITTLNKNKDGSILIITKNQQIYLYDGKKFHLWGHVSKGLHGNCYQLTDSIFCILLNKDVGSEVVFFSPTGNIISRQIVPNADMLQFVHIPPPTKHLECPPIFLEYINNKAFLIKVDVAQGVNYIDSTQRNHLRCYLANDHHLFKHLEKTIYAYDLEMNLVYQMDWDKKYFIPFLDKQEGIWLSNGHGHLKRVQRSNNLFQQYTPPIDRPAILPCRGIVEGLNNDLLIGRYGYLLQISKKDNSIFGRPELEGLMGAFLDEKTKKIWWANGAGVWEINATNLTDKFNYNKNSKPGGPIILIQPYMDKFGKVWVGCSTGLYYLNHQDTSINVFEGYNEYESILKKHSVFDFHENEAGMWLATSQGLFLLDYNKGLVARYHTKGKGNFFLPHNVISHIHEDKDGSFWLASKGGGLIHWNPNTSEQEQFTTQNGLWDNIIYAVYSDDYGQVWLPSNYGLMRFDKKTKEVIVYLKEHGLPDLEFNTTSHFQASDGRLYFGTVKGAIGFYPKDFVPSQITNPIQITSFKQCNNVDEIYINTSATILKTQSITLNPSDKFFELSFALLDFNNLKLHRYAYQLEGYDKNWQPLKEPTIKLNNLPYGNYKLRLRAQASGKSWQEFEYPIDIYVLKPFYWQWWFVLVVLGLFFLVIIGAFQWRIVSLKNRKKELEAIVEERTAEIAQQADELKALDKVKSRFFANISHELRTPLTLILGPISEIASKPFGMLDEKMIRKNLNLVSRNGQNLLVLIEEVLELSKLEAGKVELREKPTLLKPFVQRIHSAFESLAELNNILYRFDYNAPKELVLLIDQQKIEKIINNILSNAFKFTPPNGEIILEITETPNTILVSLKDTGMGIPEKDLPHIFERFYQSKLPNLAAQGGTGIGLALCKELVELMNGQISVTSSIDKGSHFFVEFPKKIALEKVVVETMLTSSPQIIAPEIEAKWSQNQKTILLVEDNADMSLFISSLLSLDYVVITAKNGLEGFSMLKQHGQTIELIISDVMMPLMDGFSMVKQIKENPLWQSLPIIMLTARAAEEDKIFALTTGVDDYLIKPFSSNELRVRVQNLLQNYENRKLWKQDLLIAASAIHEQQNNSNPNENLPELEENETSKQDLLWLKEIEAQIKEHLGDEQFDIESLAQNMLLSKRQLERKIKKITGLSPAKLVLEVTMQTARNYLEQGTYNSISEVSFAVGIQTPSYFSQLYVKRFGKKPMDYFR